MSSFLYVISFLAGIAACTAIVMEHRSSLAWKKQISNAVIAIFETIDIKKRKIDNRYARAMNFLDYGASIHDKEIIVSKVNEDSSMYRGICIAYGSQIKIDGGVSANANFISIKTYTDVVHVVVDDTINILVV